MSDIELKARKILAESWRACGEWDYAESIGTGGTLHRLDEMIALPALISALSPQWQPIETAPTDELIVVCWLDDEDTDHPERHEFDYIEDGMWVNHANLVEHAHAVAPPGSRIPKEQAPYQWWIPLPAPPEVE